MDWKVTGIIFFMMFESSDSNSKHVAMEYSLAGINFPHPDSVGKIQTDSLSDQIMVAGSKIAYGKFLATYGIPACRELIYYECKSNEESSVGLKLLMSAKELLAATHSAEPSSLAVMLLSTHVTMALDNLRSAASWAEMLVNHTEALDQAGTNLSPFPPSAIVDLLYSLYLLSTRNCDWPVAEQTRLLVRRQLFVRRPGTTPALFAPLQFAEFPGASAAELLSVARRAAAALSTGEAGGSRDRRGARRRRRVSGGRLRIAYINAVGFNGVTLFLAPLFIRRRDQARAGPYLPRNGRRRADGDGESGTTGPPCGDAADSAALSGGGGLF